MINARHLLLATGLLLMVYSSRGQEEVISSWPIENNLSDPTEGRRSFDIMGNVFVFGPGQSYFSGALAFQYAWGKERQHLAGAGIPLVFSDYQGLTPKLGFGDIRLKYYYFPHRDTTGKRFHSLGIGIETFAPTGREADGLSRGDWVMLATAKAGIRLHPRWVIYPIARYVFSFAETYSLNISAPPVNLPEHMDDDPGEIVSALQGEVQVTFQVPVIAAYVKLTPQYLYDMKTTSGSFSFFIMTGKMFTESFGIDLGFAAQIAGQRSFSTAWHIGLVQYLR